MIAYVKGNLEEIRAESIVVEAAGLGYEINTPNSILPLLPPIGSSVKIYTYDYHREEIHQLYGFLEAGDVRLFEQIIGVSGIGPKAGMGILSVMSPDAFRFAVLSEDAKLLSKAPLIGVKTAKKLILELKDKFEKEPSGGMTEALPIEMPKAEGAKAEAVLALEALGYGHAEALKVVSAVPDTDGLTVEQVLKQALKSL